MQKKIDYGQIPDYVLDMVVGESYSIGEYTLRFELDKYGEDILAAQYNAKVDDKGYIYLEWFRAWTKTYALILIDTMFGDRSILGLTREIPDEIIVTLNNGSEIKFDVKESKDKLRGTNGRNKKETRRTKLKARKTIK
jgi:hypothetical protein